MYKLTRPLRDIIVAPAILAAAILNGGPALAETVANDLDCVDCVQGPELEAGAVGQRELAYEAVFVTTVLVRAEGTPNENCNALLDALVDTSIATESDPYLIKLEAGIYDCRFPLVVEMNPYVDIEGSGQTTTVIRGHSLPVLKVAAHSELRQVTVEALGKASARGIEMRQNHSRLADVTVIAQAEDPDAIPSGVNIGPDNGNPNDILEFDLDHVTVHAGRPRGNGNAITVIGPSAVRMTDVRGHGAVAGLRLVNSNGALVIATGSVFEGSSHSLRVETNNTAAMVSSQLIGPLGLGAGTPHCIVSYGAFSNVLNPDCTP
ncbi:MAG: hypothetical protein AAF495_10185 [Pseudomonadota bacterium]